MKGIFVTGTDTGVGKTAVVCALAAWCRQRGIDIGVMKPVATGGVRVGDNGRARWVSDDAQQLVKAAGVNDPWPLVNPVCFKEPLAPWTAARRARTSISLAPILSAFRALAARHEFVIVEGIGGLLVPLTQRLTVADLAKRMGLPLLIVARPGLGTLNHTLLSLACLERAGLSCAGIVLNHSAPPSSDAMMRLADRTNPETLRRLTRAPVIGPLPYLPSFADGWPSAAVLSRWIERSASVLFSPQLRVLPTAGDPADRPDNAAAFAMSLITPLSSDAVDRTAGRVPLRRHPQSKRRKLRAKIEP